MRTLSMILLVLAVGCGGGSSSSQGETPSEGGGSGGETAGQGDVAPSLPGSGTDRPVLTAEECAAQGGSIVGDIGDGAIHRPEYVCPSGRAPIGSVPSGIEGSVCCP